MRKDKLRLALLISGGGTTMEKIILSCQSGELRGIDPICVISSNENVDGIRKALTHGIPKENVLSIRPRNFFKAEYFGDALIDICTERSIDLIGQFGWLPRTPENFIEAFDGRIINQHPGPLDTGRPDFGGKGMYGRRVHCARLYFVRKTNREFWTDATTHKVTKDFDKGKVLGRTQVKILEDDTPISLQERVLPCEHDLQIKVLQDFANGTVKELERKEPLILNDHEKSILEKSKKVAEILFPKG